MAEPEKPITRFEAQRKLGLFAPHDVVSGGLLGGTLSFTIAWAIWGAPSLLQLVFLLLVCLVLTGIWLVLLVFRVLVFVLDMQADINLMPETAARMAVVYLQNPSSDRLKR